MIGQYLPNNNENVTVTFCKKKLASKRCLYVNGVVVEGKMPKAVSGRGGPYVRVVWPIYIYIYKRCKCATKLYRVLKQPQNYTKFGDADNRMCRSRLQGEPPPPPQRSRCLRRCTAGTDRRRLGVQTGAGSATPVFFVEPPCSDLGHWKCLKFWTISLGRFLPHLLQSFGFLPPTGMFLANCLEHQQCILSASVGRWDQGTAVVVSPPLTQCTSGKKVGPAIEKSAIQLQPSSCTRSVVRTTNFNPSYLVVASLPLSTITCSSPTIQGPI
jgi:ribosomal protein S17